MQAIGEVRAEVGFLRKGIDDLMAEKAALEDRVSELEARVPAPEIRTGTIYRDENGLIDWAAPSLTQTGRILVDPDRYAALERIEVAARRVVEDADDCGVELRLLAELDLAVKGIKR